MRRIIPTLATIVLAAGLPSFSQSPRVPAERVQDRRDARADRGERRDDLRDLARLNEIAAKFDAARAAHDQTGLNEARAALRTAAMEEIQEGRLEQVRARGEIGRDGAEVRSDGRRVLQEASAGDLAPVARQNLRDDRRTRRDDVRDATAQAQIQQRRLQIAAAIRDMPSPIDAEHLTRERTLLGELIVLARADALRDGAEIREDRLEKAEDIRRP